MPTAPRLVAAIVLSFVGYIVSALIIPLLPEGTNPGYFVYVNAALGLVIGWQSVGTRVGRGWTAAINAGLTGGVLLTVVGLAIQGANEMVRLAMKNRYDGPIEAIAAVFEIAIEFSLIMIDVQVLTALIVGCILSGLCAEIAGRLWR